LSIRACQYLFFSLLFFSTSFYKIFNLDQKRII
jgi:hypothetical protein